MAVLNKQMRDTYIMKYANQYGYSDVYPYEVVNVISDKTIEIRKMNSILDPNFKCDTVPGGFFGHTVNNDAQSYTYQSIPDYPTMRIRYSKAKTGWYSACGSRYMLESQPVRFYDYNF